MNLEHNEIRGLAGQRDSTDLNCTKIDTSFVQLEIQIGALRRLITSHSLVIKEVHCSNDQSKSIIKQALLDSLAEAIG